MACAAAWATSCGWSGEGRVHGPGEARELRVSRPHDEHGVTGAHLAPDPGHHALVVGRIAAAERRGQIAAEIATRDVACGRPAGVEDLRVAEPVVRPQGAGQQLAKLGA